LVPLNSEHHHLIPFENVVSSFPYWDNKQFSCHQDGVFRDMGSLDEQFIHQDESFSETLIFG
ncbi:hypothetical protein ACU4EV_14655, partial [Staphylococcus aureus]|uniref:hypothetical protein n=1 Tax=Staphylococcus aureus TaxID=1280 RepID=UPI00406BC4F5